MIAPLAAGADWGHHGGLVLDLGGASASTDCGVVYALAAANAYGSGRYAGVAAGGGGSRAPVDD